MPPPLAKKQKRLIVLSSDDDYGEDDDNDKPTEKENCVRLSSTAVNEGAGADSTAALPTRARTKTSTTKFGSNKSTPASSPKKISKSTKRAPKSASLYSFFNAATQTQREGSLPRATPPIAEQEEEDLIQDDSPNEAILSSTQTQKDQQHAGNVHKRPRAPTFGSQTLVCKEIHPNVSQRFLNPHKSSQGSTTSAVLSTSSGKGTRPWAEEFAPTNLEELAVHKKKVSDVRNWLENVMGGRDHKVCCQSPARVHYLTLTLCKRLLVLKGSSGTGKTATLTTLSTTLGFDIAEWKNPSSSDFSSDSFLSMSAQFEDFLSRSGTFNGLTLQLSTSKAPSPSIARPSDQRKKVILIEEFPNTFSRTSTATASFRSSVLKFLALSTPSLGSLFAKRHESSGPITPIIMIISETLITSTTAAAESFTAHRLLGPEILSHPGTTMMEFNPIAPTILTKALDLVIRKEARQSGRRRTPGPAVLRKLSEIGDVRSAIGCLEFMCVRGDDSGDWGGRVATKGNSGAKSAAALTKMEQESIEMVTQREVTLGIFHAVGKVVYNKRDEVPASDPHIDPPVQPPDHLYHYARPRVSQVSVDELMDETGTDVSTFVAALHENYVLSCDCPESMDAINGCLDALSDSDLLSAERRGGAGTRHNSGLRNFQGSSQESLRQGEICFQVAVRGILFALPYPVKRRAANTGTGSRGGGKNDLFKMFYPTSLRLWKQTEEVEALIDRYTDASMARTLILSEKSAGMPSGVEMWASKSNAMFITGEILPAFEDPVHLPLVVGVNSARTEMILERLPYIAKIERRHQKHGRKRDLEILTQFHGINAPDDSVPDEEDEDRTSFSQMGSAIDERAKTSSIRPINMGSGKAGFGTSQGGFSSFHPVEQAVGKLVISDDDIEDD